LAELLGHVPDPRKRPGTIKSIVEHTGLDRHQVANLLKNEVKYIPLQALSRLCDYLIEHGYVTADQLPGVLFAVEPENFWELLARRRRLELCLGVRRANREEWAEGAWVVASDSLLLGALLNGVSTLGGAAQHGASDEADQGRERKISTPHPEHIRQSLVWSPGQGTAEEVAERAGTVFQKFARSPHDKALLCLGSTKSNPVVELVLADSFGCTPFKSQDDVRTPTERSCPIWFRYRDEDPKPPSCAGGVTLSQGGESKMPGIYFEGPGGKWDHVPWQDSNQDAAMVFYIHRESQGRLEMALGGFSGRATRLLARTLATDAQSFWPPVYVGQGISIGAYIVQYTFNSMDNQDRDILETELTATSRVIPVDGEAVRRRIERVRNE
jgi:hypothetical protein